MNVLFLTNSFDGLYSFRKELIKKILSETHKVNIVAPQSEHSEDFSNMGCEVRSIQFERHGKNPFKELKLIRIYKKLIKEIKPDIVLTYTIKPNIYGGMACATLKVPYIANITGLGMSFENKGLLKKFVIQLYKYGLRRAQKVFFQNSKNQQVMLKFGIIKCDYELIPGSGVNLQEYNFLPYPEEQDKIRFLFIGRVMKNKGVGEFLECAEYIRGKYPNTEFDMIGGYDGDAYLKQIESLQERGIVNFFGKQKDVKSFISSHHATILPSYHEGMSNALLESAACGRPVIATNVAGCKETFDDGISGFSCEARSTQSLIEAVERFLALPYEQKVAMGLAGRKKMETEFDRRIVTDAYMKEIEKTEERNEFISETHR